MPIIKTINLKKEYTVGTQTVRALRGINLSLEQGEFMAIMGPSGSGKTTLMNIIGCLDTPSCGSYELNGISVDSLEDDELANIRNKEIGFVFQSFNLLAKNSTLDNVMLPLKYAGLNKKEAIIKAKEVIEKVGLIDRLDHTPAELSGGQQQRVAIARALVNNPSIVFADEPTGNLDSKTGDEVMELFKELNSNGQTIILITHEDSIAQQSNRVITIMDGLIKSDNRE
tara:strand:+ start:534 stop:1214 length:681 start_codon:yes stop_codon:yes gene_type:complete